MGIDGSDYIHMSVPYFVKDSWINSCLIIVVFVFIAIYFNLYHYLYNLNTFAIIYVSLFVFWRACILIFGTKVKTFNCNYDFDFSLTMSV